MIGNAKINLVQKIMFAPKVVGHWEWVVENASKPAKTIDNAKINLIQEIMSVAKVLGNWEWVMENAC